MSMPIHDELNQVLSGIEGHTGVIAYAIAPRSDGTDAPEPVAIHADRSFTLASVVKLPLLIHLLRKLDRGEIDLGARTLLKDDERVAGSGLIQVLDAGLQPTVHDLMRLMMIISDNMATDLLLALSSKEAVQADMHALGYDSFHMPHSIRQMLGSFLPGGEHMPYADVIATFRQADRPIPDDPDGNSAERGDRATPRHLAAMLVDLHDGKLASAKATEVGMTILKACQTNSRIPYDLPKGTEVAHKTGTLNRRTNDVGIVFGPKGPYVVALMNHGELDERKASATLAKASRLLYDHFA